MKSKNQSKKSLLKPWLSLAGYFGLLFTLFFISNVAMAGGSSADLGTVAGNITKTMSNVEKLITAGAYVAGIAFALMGMLKFKAHKDNPTQVSLSQPIVLLAIAAGLVFIPSLIGSTGATIWGGQAQKASATGSGLD